MNILIIENAPASQTRWEDEAASDRGVEVAAGAVERTLRVAGHVVSRFAVTPDPVPLIEKVRQSRPDVAFNFCETIAGRTELEPAAPYLLRWLGIPFTGCPPETLALLIDKIRTKSLFRGLGIPTPDFRSLSGEADFVGWEAWPAILKPVTEDASLGIDSGSVVASAPAARERFALLAGRFGTPVLMERFVEGREINVSLLETENGPRTALNEIDFSAVPTGRPRILTYAAKWAEDSEEFLSTPARPCARLAPSLDAQVRSLGLRIYRDFGIRGYARVDLRIDETGRPFVLEVNPNPDLSPDAGFARSLQELGMSYPTCLETLLQAARRGGSGS